MDESLPSGFEDHEALRLSEKSLVVLRLIAEGHSLGQIVDSQPTIKYPDICRAAQQALTVNAAWIGETRARRNRASRIRARKARGQSAGACDATAIEEQPTFQERVQAAKSGHPRAYERWSKEEDAELISSHAMGLSAEEIATDLWRQPTAVQARLFKLGLVDDFRLPARVETDGV